MHAQTPNLFVGLVLILVFAELWLDRRWFGRSILAASSSERSQRLVHFAKSFGVSWFVLTCHALHTLLLLFDLSGLLAMEFMHCSSCNQHVGARSNMIVSSMQVNKKKETA